MPGAVAGRTRDYRKEIAAPRAVAAIRRGIAARKGGYALALKGDQAPSHDDECPSQASWNRGEWRQNPGRRLREACIQGVATWPIDDLVEAMGGTGISKSDRLLVSAANQPGVHAPRPAGVLEARSAPATDWSRKWR